MKIHDMPRPHTGLERTAMRLTLDLTPTLLRSAGVKNHLFYWTRALAAARGAHQLQYFPYIDGLTALDHDHGLEQGIPDWRLFLVAAMNFPATHAMAKLLVPRFDLFHGSTQARLPPRAHRLTSHIHDLTCWRMPELHTRANTAAAYQIAAHMWRRADGLIAVSQSARQDAIELLDLNPDKIQVIYHGVPEEYFTAVPAEHERPYVLSLGTIEPRKNIDALLNAWPGLPADVRDAFDLVVAGPPGWKSGSTLARLQSGMAGVRYLGYVPESDLPGLTAGATALAYPSLYEGFGFPIAQAMACGVPAVTSHISSMPEVAAGSALLVDPHSVAEITTALLQMLTSPALRKKLGARGRAHAALHYRWPLIARQSWEFFERVLG